MSLACEYSAAFQEYLLYLRKFLTIERANTKGLCFLISYLIIPELLIQSKSNSPTNIFKYALSFVLPWKLYSDSYYYHWIWIIRLAKFYDVRIRIHIPPLKHICKEFVFSLFRFKLERDIPLNWFLGKCIEGGHRDEICSPTWVNSVAGTLPTYVYDVFQEGDETHIPLALNLFTWRACLLSCSSSLKMR